MTDLTYTNKAGISLQNVLDVLITGNGKGKKDIQNDLDTNKNIDVLLKKLEEASLVKKKKKGNKLLYTVSPKAKKAAKEESKPVIVEEKSIEDVEEISIANTKMEDLVEEKEEKFVSDEIIDEPQSRKRVKARPTRTKTPGQVKEINERTANVSKDHQITSLVEVDDDEKKKEEKPGVKRTDEINQDALDTLKKEMEGKLGKEVTAVLHKRNDRAKKQRKKTPQELYELEQAQSIEDNTTEDLEHENPYRFIMNFFTSTLNGEKATPYFRRRDEHVVKSIYNKFKSISTPIDAYTVTPQNLPFYRVITIDENELIVKIYHIDMNRIVRGVHNVFRLRDDGLLKFKV